MVSKVPDPLDVPKKSPPGIQGGFPLHEQERVTCDLKTLQMQSREEMLFFSQRNLASQVLLEKWSRWTASHSRSDFPPWNPSTGARTCDPAPRAVSLTPGMQLGRTRGTLQVLPW